MEGFLDLLSQTWPGFLKAAGFTVQLTAVALLIGIVIGLMFAFFRISMDKGWGGLRERVVTRATCAGQGRPGSILTGLIYWQGIRAASAALTFYRAESPSIAWRWLCRSGREICFYFPCRAFA